jgi:hypothetical protein
MAKKLQIKQCRDGERERKIELERTHRVGKTKKIDKTNRGTGKERVVYF